ncbi:MAG TPA: CCA tRNA nucleotidyltransferase [Chthoniobacterales bacterium]|nr:CCA tRNA nucleotidyltransferase [Chthoniobacterales bacterium]
MLLSDSLSLVASKLVRRLRKSGFIAYFAGGCVRDALLRKQPKDIDIATDAEPDDVQKLFARTVAVGAKFGVVRVLEGGSEFEVATFRSDGVYLDGRRPVTVTFSSPEEDAKRRDFTINGMFYDPVADQVVDFVDGKSDLEHRLVRAIGDPSERFSEDHLRLLRAVRFAAALDFEIEPATWKAVTEKAHQIRTVSQERIRDELMKIMADPHRVRGLDLLDQSGLLKNILPEVSRLHDCEQPPQFHPEGDVYVHTRLMLSLLPAHVSPLLALSVLLHDIGKPVTYSFDEVDQRIRFNGHDQVGADIAAEIMTRFRFSNEEIDTVVEAIRNHMVFKDTPNMRPARLRRFMGRQNFPLELELHRVDCLGSHGDLQTYDLLVNKQKEFENEPIIPPPLVTGHDLIALGLKPGPRFGEILEAVQTAQLDGEIKDRAGALRLLQTLEPSIPASEIEKLAEL